MYAHILCPTDCDIHAVAVEEERNTARGILHRRRSKREEQHRRAITAESLVSRTVKSRAITRRDRLSLIGVVRAFRDETPQFLRGDTRGSK